MFAKAKNIDTAFKQVQRFSVMLIVSCSIVAGISIYESFKTITEAHKRIYILSGGKALEAFAADRVENIPVEARDHVKTFHQLFFTLDPDEKVIFSNIAKAFYFADASVKKQYDNLKESGYYTNLITANISQRISVDSISVNINSYPYYFKCISREKLIRTTSIVTRSLVTEGWLRNVERSDNNPHGFLIERWTIIENKDLNIENR